MPRSATIRPNSDLVRPPEWAPVFYPTAWQCLADGTLGSPADASYVENAFDFQGMLLGLGDVTDSAYVNNEVAIQQVRIKVRGKRGGLPNSLRAYLQIATSTDAANYDDWALSAVFSNFNGKWRTTAPTGQVWSKAGITALGVVLYPNFNLDVFASELEIEVQYAIPPVTTVTGPTGTVETANPTATWTRTHEDGYAQSAYQVRVFDQATYSRGDFNPATSTPVADSSVQSGAGLSWTISTALANGSTYKVYARTAVNTGGQTLWSVWTAAASAFTVSYDAPAVPTLSAVAESANGRVRLEVQALDNLLSTQEANAERVTDVETWAKVTSTMTVDRSNTVADRGTWSVRFTKTTSSGDMTAGPTNLAFAVAGEQVSGSIRARCGVNARSFKVTLTAYNALGGTLGSANSGNVACSTGAWTTVKVDGYTLPASTAYVGLTVTVVAAGTTGGEVHYVDSALLVRGATAPAWTRGGFWTRNLLLADDSDFETTVGSWVAANTNTTVTRSTTVGGQHGTAAMRLAAGVELAGVAARVAAYDVMPNQGYAIIAFYRPGTGSAEAAMSVEWFDADMNSLGVTVGPSASVSSGSWTPQLFTTTAPAGAAYASIIVSYNGSLANGSFWYVDAVSLAAYDAAGTALLWSRGQDSAVRTALVVEASDDAGLTWAAIRNGDAITPNIVQHATVYDYEIPPGVTRQYRARTESVDPFIAAAPQKIASANTTPVGASVVVDRWWLKSLSDPMASLGFTVDVLAVKGGVSRSMDERVGEFVGIGSSLPIHVSDAVGGQDGQLVIRVYDAAAWAAVLTLLEDPAPLLLVDPIAQDQRYVKLLRRSWDEGVVGTGAFRLLTVGYRETSRP